MTASAVLYLNESFLSVLRRIPPTTESIRSQYPLRCWAPPFPSNGAVILSLVVFGL